MPDDSMTDGEASKMLAFALAANDTEQRLWPPEGQQHAVMIWERSKGFVPSANSVIDNIGEERAERLLPAIVQRRQFFNGLVGYRASCHYCSTEKEGLQNFDFALTAVTSKGWAAGAVTAVASMATVPLLGVGALVIPGLSYKGATIHLRLAVCPKCKAKNKNLFGLFMINKDRASRHPMWQTLQEAGFTKYADFTDMPVGTTVNYGYEDLRWFQRLAQAGA